jgi:hypothetical protein
VTTGAKVREAGAKENRVVARVRNFIDHQRNRNADRSMTSERLRREGVETGAETGVNRDEIDGADGFGN